MKWWFHRIVVLAACLAALAPVVSAPESELAAPPWILAERDPEFQRSTPLIATPWLDKRESGGIVYFPYSAPARIERFDLATGSWLADILLVEAPTAFWVDADGLYVSFGRRTSRFALDGTGELHLRNTSVDATALFTIGDVLYVYAPDDLLSANKWSGALIDQEEYWYQMQGFSILPTGDRVFARSVGVGPSDILEVVLEPDGTLGTQDDSPYHGDYPDASKTWVFPDGTRVTDDSGVVYQTTDLTYLSSLPGAFDDLDFDGGLPIVLRGGILYSLSDTGLRTGQYTPAQPSLGIVVHGSSVFSFYQDVSGVQAAEIPLALLVQPTPGPPVDPVGLEYEPDALALGADEVIYLLSAGNLSVFRWSILQKQYLETISLVEAPSFMAYSAANQALYLAHDSGEITVIDLGGSGALVEVPFVNSPQEPCGLATAGQYLFVCDPSGAWVSHFTYSPTGALISQKEWNHYSQEYVWSAANRKMYHFRDSTSPNDLIWEEIDSNGVIGASMDSPVHSSAGIIHPIRVAPDGSLVVLGSGRLYDAISLVQVDTLSNDIDDAVWAAGVLFTVRSFGGQSQIQKWNLPNWGVGASRLVLGAPLRLFFNGDRLLAVTLMDGKPMFTISNVDLSMIFADGFESGDLTAWSAAGGDYAGLLTTHVGAAAAGAFGAEAEVGGSCAAIEDLLIVGPPGPVEGTFFACNSVVAADAEVGDAGATLAAGNFVGLDSGFTVPEAATFAAVLDPGAAGGLAYVGDASPQQVGTYNIRLRLDLDGLTLADGDLLEHLVAYQSVGEVQFRVLLLWNATLGEKRLALEVRQDDGTFLTTLGVEEVVLPAGWMFLDLAWRAGGGDGYFLVSVDKGPFVGLVAVDNALQTVDRVRWGNVGGIVNGTTGSLLLDDFESWE